MENNFDNIPEDNKPVYTDPNADVKVDENESFHTQNTDTSRQESGPQGYNYGCQNQEMSGGSANNYNYSYENNGTPDSTQNYNYQDSTGYNTSGYANYTQNYDPGLDTSPMSFGDWLLTLLVMIIPCGFFLYIYWAFSKTGNLNRRNFSRAYLVILAVSAVIGIILVAVCSTILIGSMAVGGY